MPRFTNKHAALQWRLNKRKEKIVKVERLLQEIHRLEEEIEKLHGQDEDTGETVYQALYEPRGTAET